LFLKYYITRASNVMSSSSSSSESSDESSSSSREGGEEEEEDQAARLVRAAVRATSEVCVFFFFLLVLFEEFSSFFLPRCVYVLNSLSLSYSLSDRAGPLNDHTNSSKRFKRRFSTVHVVPVQKFMVQEVTSHSREFQAVLFLRGIERFRGVCFSGFSIEMVDRKSSAKVVGTRR